MKKRYLGKKFMQLRSRNLKRNKKKMYPVDSQKEKLEWPVKG